MSTMELRQSLLQEIANIIDSDELTRKTLEYVRKLRTKEAKKKEIETKEDLTPYTMEEINSWMDEAEAEKKPEYPGCRMKRYLVIWRRNIPGYACIPPSPWSNRIIT